jgi:hypothetical protein
MVLLLTVSLPKVSMPAPRLPLMVLFLLSLCGIVLCRENPWDNQDRQNSDCDCQDEVLEFHCRSSSC